MTTADILSMLVAFPTVSTMPTIDIATWIGDFLKERGAQVEIIRGEEEGKAALYGRLGPDIQGGVMMAGHLDVVPVEGQHWQSDPYQLTERDSKLYGRGACDMKGFIAAILSLVQRIDAAHLKKPLHIALTYDEEITMEGAIKLCAWMKEHAVKPDWIWLGEPTEMEVVTAHKGTGTFRTTITGAAAHSSLPAKGVSAIEQGIKIGDWLMKKSEAYAAIPVVGSIFDPPYSSINIGIFNGGTAANIIAEKCTLEWLYRLHPNDDDEELITAYQKMIEESIRPVLAPFAHASVKTDELTRIPPFQAPKNTHAEQFMIQRTGKGAPVAVSYATEAGIYQSITPSVLICGPGSIGKAHQQDEYVSIDDLQQCDRMMDQCVEAFLA
ncbi:MAG: acetylornithine deacetylase [Bdellovibrionales bacterium]